MKVQCSLNLISVNVRFKFRILSKVKPLYFWNVKCAEMIHKNVDLVFVSLWSFQAILKCKDSYHIILQRHCGDSKKDGIGLVGAIQLTS